MNFEDNLRLGYVRSIGKNKNRANSLIRSADQAIETAKMMPLEDFSLKSIFRELYEGLRQYCEAIGFLKGYKFMSHEVITYFLRDSLNETKMAEKFDRYRKLRNGINYYGNEIETVTVKEALVDIPLIIGYLGRYLE